MLTSVVLGLGGIIDTLALYWLLFSLFIQRGPIVPQVMPRASRWLSFPCDFSYFVRMNDIARLLLLLLSASPASIRLFPTRLSFVA